MTKNGFKCPRCGVVHKEYVILGKISSPRCMKCNKLVARRLVPNKYVQHRPKKRGKKRGRFTSLFKRGRGKDTGVKGEKGRKEKKPVKGEEGRKEKENNSLFVTPRRSHDILEDVLREFGCKERFIDAMVRRSERTKGMYPGDLRHYLSTMNSGIGTKGQADYIADEYSLALNDEKDKASSQDLKKSYPVGGRKHERYEHPSEVRREGYHPEHPEEKHARSYKEPHQARREREERISREDVREMMEDTLDRREQKREREEVLRSMGSRMSRLERDMASIPSRINEELSKILEKSKEAEKPKEITEADIKNTVKNTALNLEKKYIERDFERSVKESREREKEFQKAVESLSKQHKEREKEFQKNIEGLSKERNELLEKLTTRRTADLSGYQSDSGRVIGEAVSGLKDVIETRQPMKLVVEGLPRLLYPTTFAKGEKRPVMKEEKIEGGGVAQYLDNEYVEESEA